MIPCDNFVRPYCTFLKVEPSVTDIKCVLCLCSKGLRPPKLFVFFPEVRVFLELFAMGAQHINAMLQTAAA